MSESGFSTAHNDQDNTHTGIVSSSYLADDGVEDETAEVGDGIQDINELLVDSLEVLKTNLRHCGLGRPMNILVLGSKGVGKSSCINTFAAGLCGTFASRAQFGEAADSADNDTLTTNYTCYDRMGLKEFELEAFKRERCWDTDSLSLPRIFDIAGVPTELNAGYVEVIRRVLYGLVEPGVDINRLFRIAQNEGAAGVEREVPLVQEGRGGGGVGGDTRRIDRVVIVVDGITDPDEGFLKMAMEAISPKREHFHSERFPYFCLMTKADCLTQVEVYESRKRQVLSTLQMLNAERYYFKNIKIYCDGTARPKRPYGYERDGRLNLGAIEALCMITNPYAEGVVAASRGGGGGADDTVLRQVADRRRQETRHGWRYYATWFAMFVLLPLAAAWYYY